MELIVFGSKILNMFQGFVNKMTVIMKFSAMGPIDIPPWCNIYLWFEVTSNTLVHQYNNTAAVQSVRCAFGHVTFEFCIYNSNLRQSFTNLYMALTGRADAECPDQVCDELQPGH
jgi:hypothetical protein